MATDYTIDASQDIIKYTWEKLKAAGVMTASNYTIAEFGGQIMPIAPVQEMPEFANRFGDHPYIIYEVMTGTAPDGDDWWKLRDEITFTIYCTDYDKITSIKNVMVDYFRRMDESARLVNSQSGLSGKFNFLCTTIMGIVMSGESEQENSRQTGEVTIGYDYVRYLDSTGAYL